MFCARESRRDHTGPSADTLTGPSDVPRYNAVTFICLFSDVSEAHGPTDRRLPEGRVLYTGCGTSFHAAQTGGRALQALELVLAPATADVLVVELKNQPGALARARIEHDKGPLRRVDHNTGGRDDAEETVVDRPVKCASVQHEFRLEGENIRRGAGDLVEVLVATLTQHVKEQHPTLE